MSQQALVGPVFATKSVASEVLNGKRRLTYGHVDKLARMLKVPTGVFFPTTGSSLPPGA